MSSVVLNRFAGLLGGVFAVLVGFGLVGSLVSLSLAERGLTGWVGWVGSAYFVGLAIGSLGGVRVIGQVGYLRAYGMLTSIASAGILLLIVLDSPLGWMLGRGVQGVALGGLFVCIESWLGADAPPDQRGRMLALYQITVYLGLIVGQALLGPLSSTPTIAFVLAAMCLTVAAIAVAWTRHEPVTSTELPPLAWGELSGLAGLGLLGAGVAGVVTGAIYTVAPAAAVVAGLDSGQVAWFMAAFIGGGLLLQMPVGRTSDYVDRRLVLGAVAALSTAGALVSMAVLNAPSALIAVSAFEGGWAFSIYTIAVAYTFDRVSVEQALTASARLLAVFCGGSIAGSALSSMALSSIGPAGFFAVILLASATLATAALSAWRIRPPLPEEERSGVVWIPRTSPVVAELHPGVESGDDVPAQGGGVGQRLADGGVVPHEGP